MSGARAVPRLAFPSDAELHLPGSKSEANRLLVAAAIRGAPVTVRGATPSDDVRHLVNGLRTLGYAATFVDEEQGVVQVGPRRADAAKSGALSCGNAGTALRFLLSLAAVTDGDWTIDGDERMRARPLQPLLDAWRQLGVDVQATDGGLPVRVRGGTSRGGDVRIDPSQSSQFVSSLLLVGAALRDGVRVAFTAQLASRSYAALTCALLRRVGVRAELTEDGAFVEPGCGGDAPTTLDVGGDWSGMGAWTCLNHLGGSRVTAANLRVGSGQADEALGALLSSLDGDGERAVDVAAMPDQFLNLAIVAALRDGTTRITGAENVRVKECDRVAVMARELRRLGVDVNERRDGLTVRGTGSLGAGTIDPEDDHRVAMAFALAGLLRGGVELRDPDCVAKSYPTFWRDVERVRAQHRAIALVGMRGAGKTTLGGRLAERLGSAFVDTDAAFVERHGAIDAFARANGWPAFRREEQAIVRDSLRPGTVVATGGGCVEVEATRAALRERAFVVFVDAPVELLRERLRDGSRPSLTGAPITEELDAVLSQREPLYRALADRTVAAELDVDEQLRALTRPPA